jgi:hypothetical protein
MNFTPYIQAVNQYLAKDIIIDGHALPVKYIAGAAGTILGLTAINVNNNPANKHHNLNQHINIIPLDIR